MKIVPIDKLPPVAKKKLQKLLEDFVNGDADKVEVIFSSDEYRNSISCYSSIYKAAKISRYPIRVITMNGRVFIEKE